MIPTDVVKGLSGGATLEELMMMVRDLQIAHAQRDSGGQSCDRRPLTDQRCMWCDAIGRVRRECAGFATALKSNVVYLWNIDGYMHVRPGNP